MVLQQGPVEVKNENFRVDIPGITQYGGDDLDLMRKK